MSASAAIAGRFQAARRDPSLAVIEGFHALKHAVRFGADVLDVRTVDPDGLRELAAALAPDIADRLAARARVVDADTFAALAPTPHPTGVVGVARRPAVDLDAVLDDPGPAPVVLLERPTHHGNIGAAVRVAAAAGAAGVLVTGPHDPWHPAAIRGGAGLQFALPVVQLDGPWLTRVVASDRPLVALDPEGEELHPVGATEGTRAERAVLAFGSERTGVSPDLLDRADLRIAIPMRPGVSSLNLATAVAVVLYGLGGGGVAWP